MKMFYKDLIHVNLQYHIHLTINIVSSWKKSLLLRYVYIYKNRLCWIVIHSPLMLEKDILAFGVITMPADALAPKVARTSAGMVLAV